MLDTRMLGEKGLLEVVWTHVYGKITQPKANLCHDIYTEIKNYSNLQVKKQEKINALEVTVLLRKSQLALPIEQYADPSSDGPLLVFPEEKWRALQRRTEELKAERVMHKNKFK